MGPKGAVEIIYRKQIEEAEDPEVAEAGFIEQYRRKFANPYIAAERGFIDNVIAPHETRATLIRGLRMLKNKVSTNPKKKHGNIPL
jgi:acetyl-CoA carboxylase carboxyltransferase component